MTFKLDFSSLGKKKETPMPASLLETFDQLDRKASHESLRVTQIEALTAMNDQCMERDIILKLGTGAGKTIIGLVYGEYMRRRYPGEPVVFLCTTRQLVDQVCQSAQMIGVAVETFPATGLPYASLEGRSILLCTYDKVFNGRSVFESNDIRPAAVIMDDVHAGIDRVQQTFSVTVPDEAYHEIRALLNESCASNDPGLWRGVQNNEFDARFEVPFWIYQACQKSIFDVLEKYRDSLELIFNLANLRRYAEFSRLCITGTKAELSYYVPPVEEIRSFEDAKHRLFMSASIKDGGSLIRDLGCSLSALARVVEPPSDKGVGERMIVPISLVDASISKEQIGLLCKDYSVSTNVVVLCSSNRQAKTWVEQGATLVKTETMEAALSQLRVNSKRQFYVFSQRFDGLDLADDACRVLVLDGVPSGERISDEIDNSRQRSVPAHYIDAVNKFEQALGRAVRSSADFAAVLLVGYDLGTFIGRKAVKNFLEPVTLKQIEVGKNIAEQLAGAGQSLDGIGFAIKLLLSRDPDWKEGHREAMAAIAKDGRPAGQTTENEKVADFERHAWLAAKSRKIQDAQELLRKAIEVASNSPLTQAELLYRMAGYVNFLDAGEALKVHHAAYKLNPELPRPVELPSKRYLRATEQVVNIRNYFSAFTTASAAIADLEGLKAKLSYGHSADAVESALQELGMILGANSSRPEKETNRGPDVLWQFPELTFCVEAKSEKTAPVYKDDAKQLLLSTEWCRNEVDVDKDNVVSVFATNSVEVDRPEDVAFGPLLLNESVAVGLVDDLKKVVAAMSFDGPLFSNTARIAELIGQAKLTPGGIKARLARFK